MIPSLQDIEQFLPFVRPLFDGLRSARDFFKSAKQEKSESRVALPSVHISGGTFYQSPVGIGGVVDQFASIEANRAPTFVAAFEPDVRLGDAFWRAFLKTWDKPTHDTNLMAMTEPWAGYWDQFYSFVESDVRQAAFDGKIPVWGRRVRNWVLEQTQQPVREQIPSEFWKHNWISVLDFVRHEPENLTTTADPLYNEKEKWRDLWTNRDSVERVWPPVDQGPIRLDVGEAGGFFETKRAGSLYTHSRILKIRISNADPRRTITGCKVYLTDISPHEYNGPWLLKEGFSLAAGDHEFVPLTSYTEPDNIKISPYGDTFMEILTTKNRPLPSSRVRHVLTIRATAFDSAYCELKCSLWVDDTGRLRIAKIEG